MSNAVLILNAGSSTLKFALFDATSALSPLVRGEVEEITIAPRLVSRDNENNILINHRWPNSHTDQFAIILKWLLEYIESYQGHDGLTAVGHRVVHGGARYIKPERVAPALLQSLVDLIPLDPIHMPHNIAPIRAIAELRPELSQVVCFDTAFHHTLPPVAQRFALPRALFDTGIRRYGFHGLSYEYIAGRLREQSPALARGRVVVAHLGAGASLCGLLNGDSVATTFGFSVLDGLVMATRCGSVDPGVILYLGRQGYTFADVEDMLYSRSGLLGVSGISGDIRVLLKSKDIHAREAVDLFVYRLAVEIAGMAGALGGLDGIVFTAGIGQHSPEIRQAVCQRLAWLGVRLDHAANDASEPRISVPESEIEVRVIATDEEVMIARHVRDLLSSFKKTDRNIGQHDD